MDWIPMSQMQTDWTHLLLHCPKTFCSKKYLSTSGYVNKLLSWVTGFFELKLGLSEWKWMKQIYWWKHGCETLWDHSEDWWYDCFLLKLPVKYYPGEGFWEETISWIWLDISLLRNSLYWYGMFLRSFLRRKHIWILYIRSKYLVIWVFPLPVQNEEDLWEVPVGSS